MFVFCFRNRTHSITFLPLQPSRTFVTCVQFEPDGDVITADHDGFITIYSVDADGAYFVRMEFEAHSKAISCLVMLSEGTLISGGEKDRKIAAWDSLQNYKRITDIKVGCFGAGLFEEPSLNGNFVPNSYRNQPEEFARSTRNDRVEMMETSTLGLRGTTFWKDRYSVGSIRSSLATASSYGHWQHIPTTRCLQPEVTIST